MIDSPRRIIDIIERNNLGYILGNAVRSIFHAVNAEVSIPPDCTDIDALYNHKRLQHLKDARAFLNIEIKRLSRQVK